MTAKFFMTSDVEASTCDDDHGTLLRISLPGDCREDCKQSDCKLLKPHGAIEYACK